MDWPRPRTVLLVDDSAIVRERLAQIVMTLPNLAIVGQCEDAESAMSALVRMVPDILLLEIRLRGGGGMKLLKHAAQHYPDTRIIILTNQAEDQTRRICLNNGAHHFVDKSADIDKLAGLLATTVELKSRR